MDKKVLAALLCAAVLTTSGCASTGTSATAPPKKNVVRTVQDDGTIVLHTAANQHPETRRSRPNWVCKAGKMLGVGYMLYSRPDLAADYVSDALD